MYSGSEGEDMTIDKDPSGISPLRNGTASNEEVVFDYLETPTLKPNMIEMKEFSSTSSSSSGSGSADKQRSSSSNYHTHRYANNFSGKVESSYAYEDSTHDYLEHENSLISCGFISNGFKSRSLNQSSSNYRSGLFPDDNNDDGELEQVKVEDQGCKYFTTVHKPTDGKSSRPCANSDDTIDFFSKGTTSSPQVIFMDPITFNRPNGSCSVDSKINRHQDDSLYVSNNEEVTPSDGTTKGPSSGVSISAPFISTTCFNNINSIFRTSNMIDSPPTTQSSERSEIEKRMQRRKIKQENMKKKALVIKSEDIPEYKGKLSVDEIIAFIDNTKTQTGAMLCQKATKKDDANGSLKLGKIRTQFTESTEGNSSSETSCIDKVKPKQERRDSSLSNREEGSCKADTMLKKKRRETSDVILSREASSLPTSSSASSFRTASPPADIPVSVSSESKKFSFEVEQLSSSYHSPTIHKEFITVQKKKKQKQQYHSQQGFIRGCNFETMPIVGAAPPSDQSHTVFDLQVTKAQINGKPPAASNRQSSFKPYGSFTNQNSTSKTSLPFDSSLARQGNVSDSNNNISSRSLLAQRQAFANRKVGSMADKEPAVKSESQFDPSQFPELSGSGRRNSTGSTDPKNSNDASKCFAFSYADMAAKLRQKKHSSDHQRRGSLQLTCDDIEIPALNNTETNNNPEKSTSEELKQSQEPAPVSDTSKNSALCTVFIEPVSFVYNNGVKDTKKMCNVTNNPHLVAATVENKVDSSKSFTYKVNLRYKEPVVFLDGRKNIDHSKVSDLVFIYDSAIPVEQFSKTPEMVTSASEPVLSSLNSAEAALPKAADNCQTACKNCKPLQNTNITPSAEQSTGTPDVPESAQHHYISEVDIIDDSYSKMSQFSPGGFTIGAPCMTYPYSRPSPLSNHYPSSRPPLVVKVSPMPIVSQTVSPPERKTLEIGDERESKPVRAATISQCIDVALLSTVTDSRTLPSQPPLGNRCSNSGERNREPGLGHRSMFDLCKAQMFLYAGFEECVRESKNNPTNVVVYSE